MLLNDFVLKQKRGFVENCALETPVISKTEYIVSTLCVNLNISMNNANQIILQITCSAYQNKVDCNCKIITFLQMIQQL